MKLIMDIIQIFQIINVIQNVEIILKQYLNNVMMVIMLMETVVLQNVKLKMVFIVLMVFVTLLFKVKFKSLNNKPI